MAIALVWAPSNDIHTFYWLFFRFIGIIEVPVLAFAGLYIGLDILESSLAWMISDSWNTTGLLHLFGTIPGLFLGIFMVQVKWVDCEGWDLFSVIAEHAGKGNAKSRRKKRSEKRKTGKATRKSPTKVKRANQTGNGNDQDRELRILAKIRDAIDRLETDEALALIVKRTDRDPNWNLPGSDLMYMIKACISASIGLPRSRICGSLLDDFRKVLSRAAETGFNPDRTIGATRRWPRSPSIFESS